MNHNTESRHKLVWAFVLTSLAGLSSIQSIGGYLRIQDNPVLTSVPLTSLMQVGSYVAIDKARTAAMFRSKLLSSIF